MKKAIALVLSLMLFLSCAVNAAGFAESKKINIVTTIFPIYDWVREVVGSDAEHVQLSLLLDNGVDLHSPQHRISCRSPQLTCSSMWAAKATSGWRMCWRLP